LSALLIEVLNALGHGLLEKPYENALAVEFGLRKIPFQRQAVFDVLYKGHKVGLFIPDLIAFDTVVVDTKVIDRIADHERGLMLNYLRITKLRVGVIRKEGAHGPVPGTHRRDGHLEVPRAVHEDGRA